MYEDMQPASENSISEESSDELAKEVTSVAERLDSVNRMATRVSSRVSHAVNKIVGAIPEGENQKDAAAPQGLVDEMRLSLESVEKKLSNIESEIERL